MGGLIGVGTRVGTRIGRFFGRSTGRAAAGGAAGGLLVDDIPILSEFDPTSGGGSNVLSLALLAAALFIGYRLLEGEGM